MDMKKIDFLIAATDSAQVQLIDVVLKVLKETLESDVLDGENASTYATVFLGMYQEELVNQSIQSPSEVVKAGCINIITLINRRVMESGPDS